MIATLDELRRTPRQARSVQLVDRVLEGADRLLAEGDPSALTTTRVAAEAGISVGALYQYFPDMDAIVAAVAIRHIEASNELMAGAIEGLDRSECTDPVGMLVDLFAARYRTQPGYRALWSGPRLTERLRGADRAGKEILAEGAAEIVARLGLVADRERLRVGCTVAVYACDGLLQEAFRRNPDGDPEFLEQAKEMLRGYLERVADQSRDGGGR